ncbi:MAG: DUF805 domain-containing protein [Terricaulis sp.]
MLSLLFSFHGRINRSQYWFAMLLTVFGVFLSAFLLVAVGAMLGGGGDRGKAALAAIAVMLLLMPLCAVFFWSGLAVQVKRFHDRGRTGWIAAAPFVVMAPAMSTLFGGIMGGVPPIEIGAAMGPYMTVNWLIGLLFFVDLGCLPSQEGPNKHGDPPGAPGARAPQPIPDAPSGGLTNAQSAMERAIAQRDAGPAPQANAAARPAPSGFAPQLAPATAAPRGFGRRTTR